ELVRRGTLTIPYGRASFVEYASAVDGASDELRSANDAPRNVDAVARTVAAAEEVVRDPCLEGSCDWTRQVRTLDAARAALAPDTGS
ncbi:MAG TPA: hypothetical protein VFR93_03535, partial [Candidatus Limnocylindrales bacterium]|nr:hypothetical protein [Candidatus Limnocylindrales bacterium]